MQSRNFKITLAVVIFSFLLSLFVLYTPTPVAKSDDLFSAAYVAEYIEVISREPHSVFDPVAHEDVRLYLKTQLEEFVGVSNVTEMNYTALELNEGTEYGIKNLLAVIPGQSETGILLVGHYDSRGHVGRDGELGRSYGAADDGYAIGTLLEIARLYGSQDLENSIYILMTDAEETGLYGAMLASEEPFMDKIGFIINLEARGVKGPAYMFETSANNEFVIDFYKKAELPVSYSLATAVYTVMPNLTDFTEFLQVDKQGINFAVLDNLYYYHTPHDNYTNIDLSSIQHYGSQVVPLVEAFVTDDIYSDVNYFVGEQNQVFFTILPNMFITYRESTMHALHFITLALLIGISIYLMIIKKVNLLSIVKYLGLTLAYVFGFAIIGLFLAMLIAWVGKVPFSITYVRMENTGFVTAFILVSVTAVSAFLYKKFIKTEQNKQAMLISGISLNLLLAILTGFALSGASFLFFIPALFGIISLYVLTFVKNNVVLHIALSQNILWNMLLIVPILYSLFLALTVGGLLAFILILLINISAVIPYTFKQLEI